MWIWIGIAYNVALTLILTMLGGLALTYFHAPKVRPMTSADFDFALTLIFTMPGGLALTCFHMPKPQLLKRQPEVVGLRTARGNGCNQRLMLMMTPTQTWAYLQRPWRLDRCVTPLFVPKVRPTTPADESMVISRKYSAAIRHSRTMRRASNTGARPSCSHAPL